MTRTRDQIALGIAHGAVKRGLDKVTEPISLPIAEAISTKLREINPSLDFTAPLVQSLCASILLVGLGELTDMALPHLPSEIGKKAKMGAELSKRYAGEKFGSELVEYAIKLAPLLLEAFSKISEADMVRVLDDGQDQILLAEESGQKDNTDIEEELMIREFSTVAA